MSKVQQTVGEYILFLQSKGFLINDDAIGFIYFGKRYTNAADELVNSAIEITLKAQKTFDGSFYLCLLEALKEANVQNRKQAYQFVKAKNIL